MKTETKGQIDQEAYYGFIDDLIGDRWLVPSFFTPKEEMPIGEPWKSILHLEESSYVWERLLGTVLNASVTMEVAAFALTNCILRDAANKNPNIKDTNPNSKSLNSGLSHMYCEHRNGIVFFKKHRESSKFGSGERDASIVELVHPKVRSFIASKIGDEELQRQLSSMIEIYDSKSRQRNQSIQRVDLENEPVLDMEIPF